MTIYSWFIDCFDEVIVNDKENAKYDVRSFEAIEMPDQGAGFPVHLRIRCTACLMMPIIGERFRCNICPDVNLCMNILFYSLLVRSKLLSQEEGAKRT